ncbi:MAG: RNA polymerase sigma factor [Chloroflexi bacterium]|nr:RNA polymerase sigma factor [Chloroflexota bacterium]
MSDQNLGREEAPPGLDDALILNAMKGDETALAAAYDFYARRIYRYFYSRVENTEDAEDLTAQTFMSIIEALPRYQHRGQFTAWVFQIARSKVMDFFRRDHSRVREEAGENIGAFDDTLDKVIQGQTLESLRAVLLTLAEEEHELLRLRFVVELTYREIAQTLGRREDAVRKSVDRILERLSAQMEADNG